MGVIKIAKQGFDVMDNEKERTFSKKTATPMRMYSPIILIFLNGAKTQVQEYQKSIKYYEEANDINMFLKCLHDTFTIFEDLATLGKYIAKCGDKTRKEQHELWFDIRNHIRHDIREEFDREDSEKKNKRAKRLDLDPRLQMDIELKIDKICIGGTIVTIEEINTYLNWVDTFVGNILNEAKEKGFLK